MSIYENGFSLDLDGGRFKLNPLIILIVCLFLIGRGLLYNKDWLYVFISIFLIFVYRDKIVDEYNK